MPWRQVQCQVQGAVSTRCTLIVADGANVSMDRTEFKQMCRSAADLSLFATGTGSSVHAREVGIDGGCTPLHCRLEHACRSLTLLYNMWIM